MILLILADAASTNAAGKQFLKENKDRRGVVTMLSGLQYKVLKSGSGEFHPKLQATCECKVSATTPTLTPDAILKDEIDWVQLSDTHKPRTTAKFQVQSSPIPASKEILQLMVEGDQYELYVPPELRTDATGKWKVEGDDVTIFRLELVKVKGETEPADRCDPKTLERCTGEQKQWLRSWNEKLLTVKAGTEVDALTAEAKSERAQTGKKLRDYIARKREFSQIYEEWMNEQEEEVEAGKMLYKDGTRWQTKSMEEKLADKAKELYEQRGEHHKKLADGQQRLQAEEEAIKSDGRKVALLERLIAALSAAKPRKGHKEEVVEL